MRVMFDTCVVLDYLLAREPFFDDALNLCIAAANRELDACISAASVADLYYLAKKDLDDEEKSRKLFARLFGIFDIVNTEGKACRQALTSSMPDYEDAILEEAAYTHHVDYIVTRDEGDYEGSRIPVYLPAELLTKLERQRN